MASTRIPVAFSCEYRGKAPASEFTNRESGEVIELTENLKFEYELADGDVGQLALRVDRLDEVAAFDASKLQKGERVWIEGVAVLADRGQNSYFRPLKAEREAVASAAPKAA